MLLKNLCNSAKKYLLMKIFFLLKSYWVIRWKLILILIKCHFLSTRHKQKVQICQIRTRYSQIGSYVNYFSWNVLSKILSYVPSDRAHMIVLKIRTLKRFNIVLLVERTENQFESKCSGKLVMLQVRSIT